MKEAERKFVEKMLESANASHKTQPESSLPDQTEVEQLTKSIQRRIQGGR